MDVVIKAFPIITYRMVVRWKVFRVGYLAVEGLSLPHQYSCNSDWLETRKVAAGNPRCPRDKWLLSSEDMIGDMPYASGFHVLTTEKDAEEYRKQLPYLLGGTAKMEVMVMGLKAIGQVNINRADYVDCEVYDWMRIPPVKTKLEDVSAQEIEDTIKYLFSEPVHEVVRQHG